MNPRSCAVARLVGVFLLIAGCTSVAPNRTVDDKREGPWVIYYQYGQRQEAGTYQAGAKVGTWKRWHINGELQRMMEFEAGQRHGAYVAYYNDGRPRERGQFERGKKTGEWMHYFPADKGAERIVYRDDQEISREPVAGSRPATAR